MFGRKGFVSGVSENSPPPFALRVMQLSVSVSKLESDVQRREDRYKSLRSDLDDILQKKVRPYTCLVTCHRCDNRKSLC